MKRLSIFQTVSLCMKRLWGVLPLLLMALLGMATSCQEDLTDMKEEPIPENMVEIVIDAQMPDEDKTRLHYEETGGNAYSLRWSKGDELKVICYGDDMRFRGVYTLKTEDDNVTSARFTGKVWQRSSSFKFLYSSPRLSINTDSGRVGFEYSNQKSDDVNRTLTVKDYLYLESDVIRLDSMKHVKLKMKNCLMRFEIPNSYPFNAFSSWTIRWVSNLDTEMEVGESISFKSDPSRKVDYVYLSFDPERMRLYKNKKAAFFCYGYKDKGPQQGDVEQNIFNKYLAIHSAKGKQYLPGHRYHYYVSETSSSTWLPNPSHFKAKTIKNEEGVYQLPFIIDADLPPAYLPWPTELFKDYVGFVSPTAPDYYWRILSRKMVKSIPNSMFKNDYNGTFLEGMYPFTEEFVFPEGLEVIGREAFRNYSTLKKIVLPKSLKLIDEYAFKEMPNLEEVVFQPNSSTPLVLNFAAFAGCSRLTHFTVPARCVEVGKNCFANCPVLEKVTFEPTGTAPAGEEYVIEKKPLHLGQEVFYNCPKLQPIVYPDR